MATALNPSGETVGRVAIGASALLLETRIGPLIRDCRYRYPKVQVSPRQLAIGRAHEAVRTGEVDLALVHGDLAGGGPPAAGVVVEELPPLKVVPVGTPALAQARDLAAELPQVRVLAVDADCASHRMLVTTLRQMYGIDPPVIEAGSMGGARELARAGYGIAMLPAESIGSAEGDGGLEVLRWLPGVRLGVRALWAGRDLAMSAASAVYDVASRIGREKVNQLV
ncbi:MULTISPECIES: substrate-binding domain-containing protein [Streptomyces]|uniref:Substrate-binding domain-containing protein n=1 Tax=Streptomyces sudanensis TaxID=436397 RepID=A0ABY4TKL3_9ACTN|nr:MULTISPECIES: substrate-binding domain-containing protein [Streptomyces]MCP9958941.1 substrate-binding domain-containing protein [Streptomyces sudanensis]MCQ0000582.1 substrate-binding domain-containing protein [Streptomyces sudanensis]URN18704.1 substrate-binding domain-containing protein [Streptomyces sudanensis]